MDSCLISVALLVGSFGLFYVFSIWNYGRWKKRGVPEAKAYPLLGSFPSAFTQKRHLIYDIDDVYRQYKNSDKFVGVYQGRASQLLITDPELVHKIYVDDFKSFHDNEFSDFVNEKSDLILANNPLALIGDVWKERRMEISSGVSPSRIKHSYPITLAVVDRLSHYVREQSKMSSTSGLDTHEICLRYTAEVVSDYCLGIQAVTLTDTPTTLLQEINNLLKQSIWFLIYQILVGLLPSLKYFYKAKIFSKSSEEYFLGLMAQAIELRRKDNNKDRVDFLNYLLQLQDAKQLSTRIMTAHMMTFLTEGFVTTSNAISHCLLGLARNSDAQDKLRQEILKHVNSEGTVAFETLSEMPYLDACFNESLRLFPPLMFVTKLCTQPYEFTNTNGKSFEMQKNEVVLLSHYSLNHDERFFENPEEFKPERFLNENGSVKRYRDEGKFLAFGDGPRQCMGMRFALVQGKAAIVELLLNFQLKVNSKTRSDNLLDKNEFIARLDGGVWLDFESLS